MAQAETTVDVLIVGAGLSGIGAAAHLTMQCPDKSYAILEQRADIGGTWDLYRYPGIRFDTDVYTMGYRFKPWRNKKNLAEGADVRAYIRETADEYGIAAKIRFGHRVISADWSSADGCWTVMVKRDSDDDAVTFKANFLYLAAGYYDYDAGKTVVVIGSGATAITLVPAMAETAKKVVMLQRTPTYLYPVPQTSPLDTWLRKFMPASAAHAITRRWNIRVQRFAFRMSRRNPDRMKQRLLKWTRERLPADYPTFEKDFVPPYKPWEQRACAVPEDDFYKAIASGKVEIPNMVSIFGYVNASWTLKSDIVADYVCRLLKVMDAKGAKIANPKLGKTDMPRMPFVGEFSSGYLARAADTLPVNGDRHPWRVLQHYAAEKKILTKDPVDDGVMVFSGPTKSARAESGETLIAAE